MSAYVEGTPVLPLVGEYLRRRAYEVVGRCVWVENDDVAGKHIWFTDGTRRVAMSREIASLEAVDNALEILARMPK